MSNLSQFNKEKMRRISYAKAINEALYQMMEKDSQVFVIGQGCTSPWYVGNTTAGLFDKFGRNRVIDTPVSENTMTGVASGAAIMGMRAVVIHPRMDFMIYATDQIVNEAANWHYMFGGRSNVPVVIRPIINRGGEQAAQHAQALHAWFAHVPGIKVVMPSTAYDAKGLMVSAIKDNNPVMYIDDRWLYNEEGDVPQNLYTVPIGKGQVLRRGKDVTIVGISYMVRESIKAAEELKKRKIDAEVIDVRSVKPLDMLLILNSVKKTGRLVIADSGWLTAGISAEIAARAASDGFRYLKAPIMRVALPDTPAPMSKTLEAEYYPDASDIREAVKKAIRH